VSEAALVIVAGGAVVVPVAVCWGKATTAVRKNQNTVQTWVICILAVVELSSDKARESIGDLKSVRGFLKITRSQLQGRACFYTTALGFTVAGQITAGFVSSRTIQLRKGFSLQVSNIRVPSISGAVYVGRETWKGFRSAQNPTATCNRLMKTIIGRLIIVVEKTITEQTSV
jgi:hypothetical protein